MVSQPWGHPHGVCVGHRSGHEEGVVRVFCAPAAGKLTTYAITEHLTWLQWRACVYASACGQTG
jgi:hypothetical protein